MTARDLPFPRPEAARQTLRADCARCVGLCCVAPSLVASSDFAIDKPAGQPCPHLGESFGCTIHAELRDRGFPGCTAFDCLGAGQQVVQVTFAGGVRASDWRADPALAASMFGAFAVMRQLHELLWYLSFALWVPQARPWAERLRAALRETEQLRSGSVDDLQTLDLRAVHVAVDELLREVSRAVRSSGGHAAKDRAGGSTPRPGKMLAGRDLIGKDLRRTPLAAADLRGAYLIGADLRGVDLRRADLIGADLRGADLRGTDLSSSIFLTPMQVGAARGDGATRLPALLTSPAHWPR